MDVPPQGPNSMGGMHRPNMGMSPGSAGMGPGSHMGPQMSQGQPVMGPGPGCQSMPNQMPHMMGGPGGPMGPCSGPGPMGPNGGPMPPQQQVPSEGPMLQQQSEIFVFTTQLANEAAQAVQSGQYKNILSYHMDQPSTKSFLQVPPPYSYTLPTFYRHSGLGALHPLMSVKGDNNKPPYVSVIELQS